MLHTRMSDDPARLLSAFYTGDPEAADLLARRALRIALRTAAGMVHNRELANDVAQDTAIEVLRSVQSVRDPLALDAWIQRIAVRRTMRLVKKQRQQTVREVAIHDLPDAAQPLTGEVPHAAAERRDLAGALAHALAALPAKQRMALTLRYVHDLSYDQIADAMGVRQGTAGALISRAQATLRTNGGLETFREIAKRGDVDE